MFCTFHIAGCTTRNIKLFLNTLRVVQTRNVFKKNFVLRFVQPAIYLKKVLYCELYNPQCIYFLIVLQFVQPAK